MHRDTVIGIVGVLILVAAMIGVFSYERNQAAQGGDISGFVLANLTGPSLDGDVALGAEDAQTLTINQTNLTRIVFTLTWTPGATSTDTLQLIVAPANGTGLQNGTESAAESDGEITVELLVPNEAPVSGPLALGAGDYQVTVRFVSATLSGAPTTPVPPPAGVDQNVAYRVETALTAYAPAPASA